MVAALHWYGYGSDEMIGLLQQPDNHSMSMQLHRRGSCGIVRSRLGTQL